MITRSASPGLSPPPTEDSPSFSCEDTTIEGVDVLPVDKGLIVPAAIAAYIFPEALESSRMHCHRRSDVGSRGRQGIFSP
ncbi:MAG TPA: hypothetical protein VK436_04700 [Methanocella sp.]|nr:hypothetical protein [Methanocella sp.]